MKEAKSKSSYDDGERDQSGRLMRKLAVGREMGHGWRFYDRYGPNEPPLNWSHAVTRISR